MDKLIRIITLACEAGALKKFVFSRPASNGAKKISARLCSHRGQKIISFEYSLEGNTVSQKNIRPCDLEKELTALVPEYRQINIITALGDAEYKLSKSAEAVILGGDKLLRKLDSGSEFEKVIEELDRKKSYILSGAEDFLIKLGISDKNGRVHDKRQGKFRQINKFLEYIEEIYPSLPASDRLTVFDLCCGKSYLSFAVYYYLTAIKMRDVYMLGIDLKRDVIDFCNNMADSMGFSGLHFVSDDITNTPKDITPDMVISLHACDIATDIVLDTAVKLNAKVILSTPCCHSNLASKIDCGKLGFVTKYPKLKGKLCESITDALRLERLSAFGYDVSATELVDPEDTPKNTLLRAVKRRDASEKSYEEYISLLKFLLGEKYSEYLDNL